MDEEVINTRLKATAAHSFLKGLLTGLIINILSLILLYLNY